MVKQMTSQQRSISVIAGTVIHLKIIMQVFAPCKTSYTLGINFSDIFKEYPHYVYLKNTEMV